MKYAIYFLLCLTSTSLAINPPPSDIVYDTIDYLELNHFYNEQGKIVFDQYVFNTTHPVFDKEYVRQWRLIKDSRSEIEKDEDGIPKYIGSPGFHLDLFNKVLIFNEGLVGEKRVERRIKFIWFYESWTQYDVELDNREFIDKEHRVPFSNPIGHIKP